MDADFQCIMIHGDARWEKGAAQLWLRLFKRCGMTFVLLCAHWFKTWCSLLLFLQHAHPLRCTHLRAPRIPRFYAHIVSWSVQHRLVSRHGKFGDLWRHFLTDRPLSVKPHLSRISPFHVQCHWDMNQKTSKDLIFHRKTAASPLQCKKGSWMELFYAESRLNANLEFRQAIQVKHCGLLYPLAHTARPSYTSSFTLQAPAPVGCFTDSNVTFLAQRAQKT